MRTIRASWIILFLVILIVLAVKPLRDQARLEWAASPWPHLPFQAALGHGSVPIVAVSPMQLSDNWHSKVVNHYRSRALPFVEQNYPNDSDMLLATALVVDLKGDDAQRLSLLQRAVEADGSSAAHAAHFFALRDAGPRWIRIGSMGGDPGEPESVAEAEEVLAEMNLPDRLDPEHGAVLLAALADWRAADPENGLPLAIEARVLHGLHRDEEARARWVQASTRPAIRSLNADNYRATARLLGALGMPEPEASAGSHEMRGSEALSIVRDSARFATYEGRLAQVQGRPEEAVQLWNATVDVGRRMQESSDWSMDFFVGTAVQIIGATYVWRWSPGEPDPETGAREGPLSGGRMMHGPQHAFYVGQAGEEADAALRDSRVLGLVRNMQLRDHFDDELDENLRGAAYLLFLSHVIVLQIVLAAVLFLLLSAWSRRRADDAAALRPVWQLTLAFLGALPVVIVGLVGGLSYPNARFIPMSSFWVALVFPVAAVLFLSLIVTPRSRRAPAGLLTAWRGNLRRALPIAIAVAAIAYLAVGFSARTLRISAARELAQKEGGDMGLLIAEIGPAWDNPTIPPDSWRAAEPLPLSRDGGGGGGRRGQR